tara:strand:- start:36461 stop:37645 length:1185 start_codon:yes stop_codon:yes gene_type:complete
MNSNPVILLAKRTPIGSFGGSLNSVPAPQLGAAVIRRIVKELGKEKALIDEVILGNVLSAGVGQAPARQSALLGGLNNSVECTTINKMCGSGLKAVMLAAQSIIIGDAEMVIAGGIESMSNAPFLIHGERTGYQVGHRKMIDTMIHDGLWDVYNNMHMGNCAELCAKERGIKRKDQDEFAIESYKRAQIAQNNGIFSNEIVPVEVKQSNGESIQVYLDEEPGRVKFEKISTLNPVFDTNGTITAANASKLNDGAAAVLITSDNKAKELGLKPLARLVAQASAAHEPEWFTTAPGKAISKVLKKSGLSVQDIDLWEINEAFSVVAMAAMEDYKIDHKKVNIYGGAVSLGHPIGASGARILTTLLNGLKQTNSQFGLATLCIGGGEASAVIIEKYD